MKECSKNVISLEKLIILSSILIVISSGTFLHSYGIRYFILLLIGLCIIFSKRKKIMFKKDSLVVIYGLFVLDILISIIYSSYIFNTILYSFTYIMCFIFINCNFKEESYFKIFRILEKILIVFAISILLSSLYKPLMPTLSFLTSKSASGIWYDINTAGHAGLAGDRAEAAVLMILGISLMWGKFIGKTEKNSSIIWKLILFYLALILTAKRVLFAASLVIPVIVLLFFVKGKRKIIITAALIVAVIGFGILMTQSSRFNSLYVRFTITKDYETFNGRTRLWKVSNSMYESNHLIGTGFNTFNYHANLANIRNSKPHMNPIWKYQGHNSYLQILGELGIIGITIYIFMNLFIFYKAIKIYKSKILKANQLSLFSSCVFVILMLLIYNFTGNCVYYMNQIFIYALVLSYIIYISIINKKKLGVLK